MTAAESEPESDVDVRIAAGVVRGRREGGLSVFRGIPYAQPPVGALRFAAPRPVEGWEGVRDAGEFGPPCPQAAPSLAARPSDAGTRGGDGAEDEGGAWHGDGGRRDEWLTVNVWTPEPLPGGAETGAGESGAGESGGAPVMVWIHGGAYMAGSSADPLYDGARLAREGGVVLVTLNYRVGVEGFVSLEGAPENRGLLDQVAALEWVRENIAAFGGDPGRVTVFGESAGAGSVAALLVMDRAAGLFSRAIAQSVPGTYFSPGLARDFAAAIAAEVGPDAEASAADLALVAPGRLIAAGEAVARSMPAREDRWGPVAHTSVPYSPVVDGEILPRAPWEALADGAARDIEVITGHNREEYRLFSAMGGALGRITEEQALDVLGALGPVTDSVAAYRTAYPDASAETLHELVFSDWLFRMPSLRLAEAHAASGGRTRSYELTWPAPGMGGALGACHALDVPLTFGNFAGGLAAMLMGQEPPPAAEELSARVRAEWTAFATGAGDGDGAGDGNGVGASVAGPAAGSAAGPDGAPGGAWPAYDTKERRVLVLDGTANAAVPYPEEASRRLWEAYAFTALRLPGEGIPASGS